MNSCKSAFLLLLLFISACKESLPTELDVITPPDSFFTSPVDTRNWSTLQTIPLYSVHTYAEAIASNGNDLHLLVTYGADTLQVHDRFAMDYVRYDGVTWTQKTTVEGLGIFKPASILPKSNDDVHIFWAGVRDELRQSPPTAFASDLFHCRWNGIECANPVSLYARSSPHQFRFNEANVDPAGNVYLAFYELPAIRIAKVSPVGEPEIIPVRADLMPRMLLEDDSLFLAYVGIPMPSGGSNDLYLSTGKLDVQLSEPANIFHDPARDAHHPALAIDNNRGLHIAWYAHRQDGPIEMWHAVSTDSGKSWKRTLLSTNVDLFSGPPALLLDNLGIIHLSWAHWGVLPYKNNYHATWRNGEWSEVTQLYPEIRARTKVVIASDAQDRVHIVFSDETRTFHGIYQ